MTVAYVQSNSGANVSATSLAVAYTSNNTAGGLLTAYVRIGALGRTITVSDTANGTWSTQVLTQQQSADAHQAYIFSFPNCAAGANTVTVAISGAAATIRFAIIEDSGCSSTAATEGTNSAQGITTAVASGTTSTGNAGDILRGFVTINGGATLSAEGFAGSPGGSVTVRQSISTYIYVFDIVNPGTTGSYGATGTENTGQNWTASFAAFLPSPYTSSHNGLLLVGVG